MLIAAIQLEVNDDKGKAARLEMVDALLAQINSSPRKPDLIMLPEQWGCGFGGFDKYAASSETLSGETFQLLSGWASKIGCWILGGSIVEADAGSATKSAPHKEKFYNTTLLLNREGRLEAFYRKIHLFSYGCQESEVVNPGESVVVVETELGKLGLSTCYDLRFPEQYRAMADAGAEIFLIAAAWPKTRLEHWRLFNQARAVENQCWLVSCNCAGVHDGKLLAGHSMTVSPEGKIVAEAREADGVLYSEIDVSQVQKYREDFSAFADRVPLGK